LSLARRIASSTISQVIAKFIVAGLSIISVKLVTNYLGTKGYGEYTIIYELMSFTLIIADFGFFHIALREMGKNKKKMAKILANIISLRLFLSLIAITITCGFVFFATNYNLETIKYGLMIACANVIFGLMGTTMTAVLQVHLKMIYAAMVQIIGKILMVAYVAFAAYSDLGFLHMLWAGLIGSIVICFLNYFYSRKYSKIYLGFDFKLWKELFKETLPMGIALIAYNIYLRSPIIILDRITLDSKLVGLYGVPKRIVEILMFIPVAFMNSTLPTLSELFHAKQTEDIKRKINKVIQASFDSLNILSFPIIIGTMITAPQIISLISGKDFIESVNILSILIWIILFYFLSTLFTYLLIAMRKQSFVAISNGLAAIFSVSTSLLLIPKFKIYGALIAHITPEAIALVFTYYFTRKYHQIKLKFNSMIKTLLAALFMGSILVLLPELHIVFMIIIAGILYSIGLIIFQVFPFQAVNNHFFGTIHANKEKFKETSETKRIAIDYRSIYGDKTGKEWYTFSLLQALGKIDNKNHYILYSKYDFDDSNLPANFTKRVLNVPIIIWHIHVLIDIVYNKIDIILATSSYIIASLSFFTKKFKVILTVHDLVAFLFPASKHSLKAIIIERLTGKLAFLRANKIIVPSKNTANDLRREFPSTKKKINIITEAARNSFNKKPSKEKYLNIIKKYKLPKKFIIFIGTLEPRKNLVRLLKAYSKIDKKLRDEFPLVIVGKKGWYYERIFSTVKETNIEKDVIFTGYISDDDLPCLLQQASFSIYPSKYEGFGLPLLEAMTCGTPVISSNTPALMEVAEGCCEIADRKNIDSIKQAILNLMTNKKHCQELIQKGYKKCEEYSWENTAKEVLKLLEK